jgi:hypothetical protein
MACGIWSFILHDVVSHEVPGAGDPGEEYEQPGQVCQAQVCQADEAGNWDGSNL